MGIEYVADIDATITLASLASSATFIAGREGAAVSNTVTKYIDAWLSGQITVGTSPTENTTIYVYLFVPIKDTPIYPDVFGGSDSDKTLTSIGVGRGFLKRMASLAVDSSTSDRAYPFGPISIAAACGGAMPHRWSAFVTHDTGVALNSTPANHAITYKGFTYE